MNANRQSKIIRIPQQPAMAVTAMTALPEDLTTADVDALLERAYALATQI